MQTMVLETANEAHIKWILIEISIEIDCMQIQTALGFSSYIDSSVLSCSLLKQSWNKMAKLRPFEDKNERNKIHLTMLFFPPFCGTSRSF